MKFDEFGCIITDQEDPGCLGDSAHETSRFVVLGGQVAPGVLGQFVSNAGFLRHPNAPYGPPRALDSWRESDATSDFVFPLLMASDLIDPELAERIRARLRSTWTVGPGHIAAPALMALAYRNLWLLKKLTQAQILIFKIPWRWSDSGTMRGKLWKFERSEGSSADWLNLFISILYLKRQGIVVKFDVEKVREKIVSYYKDQPNSQWVVDKYLENLS